ncbi:MAG: sulfatase-like hydrolase/transferase [Acidimicrobiales bacterium]
MFSVGGTQGSGRNVSRRQVLKGAGAVGVAAAAMAAGVSPAGAVAETVSVAPQAFVPRGPLMVQPNFLVVIVDEQRFPTSYESAALTAWRATNLPAQSQLRANGMEFRNHHTMATACAPSRTSFLTGQYPSLHGVTQTSGIAKSALEEDLYWLDPTTVPTMGAWFRAAGYDTYWKGKWHVSDADLYTPGTHQPFASTNADGSRNAAAESIYLEADMLEAFGFTGWVGPEPHGSAPANSASSGPGGSGRDEVFAAQSVELMTSLRTATRPWLAVASFVNPHDIVLWGQLALLAGQVSPATALYLQGQLNGSNVPTDLFESAAWARTLTDDLDQKPDAQQSYRDTYPHALQPTFTTSDYQRFYYQLQKTVDAQIKTVIDALVADNSTYRETVVVYLSDHGELLGSHGSMHQKWHVAYDEVIKVPFVIHNPTLFPSARSTDALTSHADLLPTMLGLAGFDQQTLISQLSNTHTQARLLPGRDLSGFLLGLSASIADDPQYFMTDDEPMRGVQQIGWNGTMYAAVTQPCHLESVIANLPTGPSGQSERWKYTRYFDNPNFWSSPNSRDAVTIVDGVMQLPGNKNANTTLKLQALPDQLEIYNTSTDPLELRNIAADPVLMATPQISEIVAELQSLLTQQAAAKRLIPSGATATATSSAPKMFRFGTNANFAQGPQGEPDADEAVAPKFTG